MVGRVVMYNVGMSAWPNYTLLFLLNVDFMPDFPNGSRDSGYCINFINISTFANKNVNEKNYRLIFTYQTNAYEFVIAQF